MAGPTARVADVREKDSGSARRVPGGGRSRRRTGSRGAPGIGIDQLKSRESRTRWDELEYFMVSASCVRCRKTVQAPVDKLHYKLRCPHCGTLMHLREDGKWYEGVHPSLGGRQVTVGWRRLRERLTRVLSGVPLLQRRSVLLGLIIIMLAICLWGVGVWWAAPGESLPTGLTGRSSLVGRALLEGDRELFERLTAPASEGDAEDWFERVRTDLNRDGAAWQTVTIEVLFQDRTQGAAGTMCRFVSTSRGDREYPLFWTFDDGEWLVDGGRTLQDFKTIGRR